MLLNRPHAIHQLVRDDVGRDLARLGGLEGLGRSMVVTVLPLAVLDALGAVAPVAAVAGNNDVAAKWPRGEGSVRTALPEAIEIALAGGSLVVVHGHQWPRAAQRHARLRARWPGARAIVYGHSHRRVTDTEETPWVLNPGAAGRARAPRS